MLEQVDFKRPIAIYGAGGGGRKVAKILLDLEYTVAAFVDSDKSKWNTVQMGIGVEQPEWLKYNNYYIIIASIGEKNIEEYLKNIGVQNRIILKEEYIMQYASDHMNELQQFAGKRVDNNKSRELILSSETGLGCWGVEQYTRTEAKIFMDNNIPVSIFTKKGPVFANEELKHKIVSFDFDREKYWDIILSEIKIITEKMPCTVQDNWQHYTLIGAVLAKCLYPESIHIVSLIHNDIPKFIKIVEYFERYISYFGAVSLDIVNNLKISFSKVTNKIVYKESPVQTTAVYNRKYELNSSKKLRIAYGGRITKIQKRTHLLLELIDFLDMKGVNYLLDIVGDGDYVIQLLKELEKKNIKETVCYKGLLKPYEMNKYWSEHDIFINLSDFEGVGLSMLEAMGSGCVPVVTKVAGSTEYIKESYNGFICDVDDIEGIADCIKVLEQNRNLLVIYGNNAMQVIKDKCSLESYVKYWGNILEVI